MLFVTNRQPKQSYRTRINRKIDFDLGKNAPSNDLYYCRRNGAGDYTEIGARALLGEVKDSSCQAAAVNGGKGKRDGACGAADLALRQ